MFFKKKRILRKAIEKEIDLIQSLRAACETDQIKKEECLDVESRWKVIAEFLQKIAPAQPLSKKDLLFRGSIAAIVLLIFSIAGGTYVKIVYFPVKEQLISSVEGTETSEVFVSEENAKTTEFDFYKSEVHSEAMDLFRSENISDQILLSGSLEDKVVIFQTVSTNQKQEIVRLVLDASNLSILSSEPVLDVSDLASITLESYDGFFYLGAIKKGSQEYLLRQYSLDWRLQQTQNIIHPEKREDFSGASLLINPYNSSKPIVFISLVRREDQASVTEKNQVLMRMFDKQLSPATPRKISTKSLNVDDHISFLPKIDGSFNLVASGKDPVSAASELRGNELYLFSYDDKSELRRIVRLTDNSRMHEFAPQNAIEIMEKNLLIIPFHRISSLRLNDRNPTETGSIFVTFLQNMNTIASSIIGKPDYPARTTKDEAMMGGKNTRILFHNGKFYIFHDAIIQEDPLDLGDGEYRILRGQWFIIPGF